MTTPFIGRLPHDFFDDAAPFKLDGIYCKLIPLTQGQFAIVWLEDYAALKCFWWRAQWCRETKSFYATRKIKDASGKWSHVKMHREILGLFVGDKRRGDHESHETLDNRRSNLRAATSLQNARNARRRKDNITGYKGVGIDQRSGKYRARIRFAGRIVFLGSFTSALVAYDAYCEAAKRLHGEFARLS
jgi:hypothetical protein